MNVRHGRCFVLALVSSVVACAENSQHGMGGSEDPGSESSAASTSTETSTATTVAETMTTGETSSTEEVTAGDSLGSGETSSGAPTDETAAAGSEGEPSADMFEIRMHLASEDDPRAPTTVGIVEWSTSAGTPSAATIQFGLTTDYGMTAPTDVTSPSSRGVLLGMKPDQTYHVRIVVSVDGEELVSDDRTITTGPAPDADRLSEVIFDVLSEDAREPGFLIGSYWNGPNDGMAFILDPDGEIVWWYDPELEEGVAKAALSADGRDLWMISPTNIGGEPLVRVGMDGLEPQTYGSTGGSHDIIPIERDVMAFINYGGGNVAEIDRTGELREVLNFEDLPNLLSGPPIHPNALAYDSTEDRYLMSDLVRDVYFFPRAGGTPENIELLTSLVGPSESWGTNVHRAMPLPENHLLLFANHGGEVEASSKVVEFDLDSGEQVWSYESGDLTSNFGDVQRLPGGNTLVTYSNAGLIHEVRPEGDLVLEITTQANLGYATWVPSLYGTSDVGSP